MITSSTVRAMTAATLQCQGMSVDALALEEGHQQELMHQAEVGRQVELVCSINFPPQKCAVVEATPPCNLGSVMSCEGGHQVLLNMQHMPLKNC